MSFTMQTRNAAAMMLLLGALLPGRAAAQDTDSTEMVDAVLFTQCATMDLLVGSLREEEARDLNLSEVAIENAAESRLRAARLFEQGVFLRSGVTHYLYIKVNLVGRAFSVDVGLNRWLPDLGFGMPGTVTVWNVGTTGTHGSDAQFVLGSISRHIDSFLTAYLRANEDACAA